MSLLAWPESWPRNCDHFQEAAYIAFPPYKYIIILARETSNDPSAVIMARETSNDPSAVIMARETSNDPSAVIMARETSNDPSAVMPKPAKGRCCNEHYIKGISTR